MQAQIVIIFEIHLTVKKNREEAPQTCKAV